MTVLAWVAVAWVVLSLPAAIGVGKALHRLSRNLPSPAVAASGEEARDRGHHLRAV